MGIKFVANDAGFAALRTSPSSDYLVKVKAQAITRAANAVPSTTDPATDEPYYEMHDAGDAERARYRVATTSIRASRHEAKTFALQRAMSSDG